MQIRIQLTKEQQARLERVAKELGTTPKEIIRTAVKNLEIVLRRAVEGRERETKTLNALLERVKDKRKRSK